MQNKISYKQIFIWILSVLPILVVLFLYQKLPDQIPTNWGLNEQVAYGGKSTIWIIAGLSPFLAILFYVLPKIDPKKQNFENFRQSYLTFQLVLQLFMMAVTGIVLLESFRPGTVDVTKLVCLLCGILFIVMGIMMPRFRQNYFCGIKTPWTLASEPVWVKTNRLGGKMILVAGCIGFAGAFLPSEMGRLLTLLIPIMVAIIIPTIMSYIWFQKGIGED